MIFLTFFLGYVTLLIFNSMCSSSLFYIKGVIKSCINNDNKCCRLYCCRPRNGQLIVLHAVVINIDVVVMQYFGYDVRSFLRLSMLCANYFYYSADYVGTLLCQKTSCLLILLLSQMTSSYICTCCVYCWIGGEKGSYCF